MKKLLFVIPVLVAGCSLIGTNPKAPSRLEEAVFQVETNKVPFIELVTNYVSIQLPTYTYKTNEVTVTKTNTVVLTNEANVVLTNISTVVRTEQVVVTNVTVQLKTNEVIVSVTNERPIYTYVANDHTKELAGGVGALVNTFAPGIGSAVTAGLLMLFGVWGHLRSTKSTQTATSLAQEVETVREFIKSLPQGAQYDQAIKQFLQSHQLENGVAQQVLGLLENQVDNDEAKNAVRQIKATFEIASGIKAP